MFAAAGAGPSCAAACLGASAAGGTAPPLEASEEAARFSAGTVATPGTAGRFKGPEPVLPSDWPLAWANSLAKQKEGSWERGTWRMLTSMPACRWSHPFTCSSRTAHTTHEAPARLWLACCPHTCTYLHDKLLHGWGDVVIGHVGAEHQGDKVTGAVGGRRVAEEVHQRIALHARRLL